LKKPKRQKHNYTSELELKSLLIRIKNKNSNLLEDYVSSSKLSDIQQNRKINKYIVVHTKLSKKKYNDYDIKQKAKTLRYKLKDKIIKLSEKVNIDKVSYEKFGEIILLMIKRILTKPQFSGYTYRDDFYSDAIYKILKYNYNFNHKLISKISNQPVNAFAYISQIIHNSVLYIINTKKKEQIRINSQVSLEILNHNLDIKDYEKNNNSKYLNEDHESRIEHVVKLDIIPNSIIDEVKLLREKFPDDYIKLIYPDDYNITLSEYNDLRKYLNKFSILKNSKLLKSKGK